MPTSISMQLQYAGLLSAIIVMCFSFCILIMTIWYKSSKIQLLLLGYSFLPAFLFNFSSLFIYNHELFAIFHSITEPILFLLILITLAAKPDKKYLNTFCFIMISIPAAIFLAIVFSYPIRIFLSQQLILLYTSLAIASITLYLLRKEKGDMKYFFWFIVILQASSFAQYYLSFEIAVFAVPSLKLGAYVTLLVFFYRVLLKLQLDQAREAEKKLSVLNRSIEIEVKKRMLEIEKVNQKLLDISKIDSMSQVMNKVAILDSIEALISRCPKSKFSILLFDIDDFKAINDTHGHIVGDKCIKLLSALSRNNIRDFDMIGRYGGDEFVVVLPNVETNRAVMIAERFRKRVDASDSPHFTISIGIATYPDDGTDVKMLIETADEGMYKSKGKGRNAVSHKTFY